MDQFTNQHFISHPNFLPSLERLNLELRQRNEEDYLLILPSAGIARQATSLINSQSSGGSKSFGQGMHIGQIKAAIYDLARPLKQLQAYQATSRVTLFEHTQATLTHFETQRLSPAISSLRGILERAGFLVENIRRLSNAIRQDGDQWNSILEASEIIQGFTQSTRMDWVSLANNDLRQVKSNEIQYRKKEGVADVSAKSVLNGIDRLNKLIPGVRVTYDLYCEFLHPNFGDLIGSTTSAKSTTHGEVRFISRNIGPGPNDIRGQVDIGMIVSSSLGIVADVFDLLVIKLDELDALVQKVKHITQDAQHRHLTRHKKLFTRGDLCPCLSGKTIRHCAPRAYKRK